MPQATRLLAGLLMAAMLITPFARAADDAAKAEKPDEKAGEKDEAKVPGEFKPIQVQKAVRDMIQEARKKMRELKVWPRQESNYAHKTNTMIESEEVIKALGRRWDRLGPMDGYVKWQLLSYQPSLVDADARELEAIVRFFPEFMPRPKPTSAQMRMFSAAAQQPLPQYKDRLREEIAKYEMAVNDVALLNMPTREYRDRIIFELPEENGLRLQVKLMDAQDRFVAGDMSYEKVMGSIIHDARSLKDDQEKLPPPVRRKLLEQVEKLKKSPNPMLENVNLLNSGEINLIKIGSIFRHKQYDQLTAYLEGRDPE